MPRVILVRHGETAWNAELRSQGWHDEPLNDRGVDQARMLGEHIRARFRIAAIWSSDLKRCMQTAEAVAPDVRPSKTLRELRFGEWEGRRWPDLHVEAPGLAARYVAGDPTFQAPGGEMLGNVIRRGERFIEEARLLDGEDDILVVGHGGSLKGLTVALLGLPDTTIGRFHFSNASISVFDAVPGLVRIHSLNETAHLAGVHPML